MALANCAESEQESDHTALVQIKGAPERILKLCDRYVSNGKVVQLDAETRGQVLDGVMSSHSTSK